MSSALPVTFPGTQTTHWTRCPDSAAGYLIASYYQQKQPSHPLLFVARDDRRMEYASSLLSFLLPSTPILHFPAWDSLPYDRISPHHKLSAERLSTLSTLLASQERTPIVLTTANALIQRIIPKEVLRSHQLILKNGSRIARDELLSFLVQNGYRRSNTANDAGEFAVRGSIVDLIPSGCEHGIRLDFMGDTIETIRQFDSATQISQGALTHIHLIPANEIILNDTSVTAFRTRYRKQFGVTTHCPLYESISESRVFPGYEHWYPLYFDHLDTLFDYLPNSPLFIDHLVEEALHERTALIQDYYEARVSALQMPSDGFVYRPIEPEQLYLSVDEIRTQWQKHTCNHFSTFDQEAFSSPNSTTLPAPIQPMSRFDASHTKDNQAQAIEQCCHYLQHASAPTLIACFSEGTKARITRLLAAHHITLPECNSLHDLRNLGIAIVSIEQGFIAPNLHIISEQDIFGERNLRHIKERRIRPEHFLQEASSLSAGEMVVHIEHGIGKFIGLETLTVNGIAHDFLALEYAGGDRFYLPVENIELLSRHGGDESTSLDRLGQTSWQERKARMKKRIQIAAEKLLAIAAERELQLAPELTSPADLYETFCARFPYAETDDQLRAIADIEADLLSGKPMDRLICGDAGFGKTEVALRAAFIAISSQPAEAGSSTPFQVAIVAPTTLLARQHYETFKARFHGLPVTIRALSRLVASKEASDTKKALADGKVDIVIGTHALLAKSIQFAKLGLLIVDEEQHFGVAQKERLKELKENIHVLSLSATPIPRTLQLALAGIKTLSIIATPPVDRLAIRTYTMPYDQVVVREALLREHFRGGRSFFVCPRISDLEEMETKLQALVPELKIVKAHGQMPADSLDKVMVGFYDGAFDVLLSTTIIESGLDVPSANTIIVHKADRFGLGQLYQLRGRVGRGKIRAYAYFTTPSHYIPTDNALKRLEVMQSLDTLGAGFSVASHDMDIRGFGNLLGDEQSGHVKEVGVELYQSMLRDTIMALRNRKSSEATLSDANTHDEEWSPTINLGISVLIPEQYVSDLALRMGLYRRLSTLQTEEEIDQFGIELIDRFGSLPEEVEHLLEVMAIKLRCKQLHIEKIDVGSKGTTLGFRHHYFPEPEKLLGLITSQNHRLKLRHDQRLLIMEEWPTAKDRLAGINRITKQIRALLQ